MDTTMLLAAENWRPIRNCPGRYVLNRRNVSPKALVGDGMVWRKFTVPTTRDRVWIAWLVDGGGLIAYEKAADIFVITLNTPAGMMRKLQQLGIDVQLDWLPDASSSAASHG